MRQYDSFYQFSKLCAAFRGGAITGKLKLMEMLYGGCGAMFLAWFVARKWFKLNDVGTIVVMTIAGGGSLITGLLYLFLADINIGNDGSLVWFLVGAAGGVLGIVVYFFVSYADWATSQAKKNGLL